MSRRILAVTLPLRWAWPVVLAFSLLPGCRSPEPDSLRWGHATDPVQCTPLPALPQSPVALGPASSGPNAPAADQGNMPIPATVAPSGVAQVGYVAESKDSHPAAGSPEGPPPSPAKAEQDYPIDLPTALQLGDESDLEIALARERINASLALYYASRVLWLPTLEANPTYVLHGGQIQQTTGEVVTAPRNSLLVAGGPVLTVDTDDALYAPLVAQQNLTARRAAADAKTNDELQKIADSYLDLLAAKAALAIALETQQHAAKLVDATVAFQKAGAGLPSDAARAETELGLRRQQLVLAKERYREASAYLAELLRLDPLVQVAPLEPTMIPLEMVADNRPLNQLVADALTNRPELAEQQALVASRVAALRQAKMGPFLPTLLVGLDAGGFGGGPGGFFGDFKDREDFTAEAVWQLQNFGFGDLALQRLRQSELDQSQIESMQVADRVAREVVVAYSQVLARREDTKMAQQTLVVAEESLRLNTIRIEGGAGLPIEDLQAIQALERARTDYLEAITAYNKAQFRLLTALGNTPAAPAGVGEPVPKPPERP